MADPDLKRRLESLLFSSGRKIELEELARHCKEENLAVIKEALYELKEELDEKQSSLMLFNEGTAWKLTVREKYLPYVKKVVKQPELPKSLLETLAVVAFKAPALQSHVIKIRTNKAYRHLDMLEESGYITREKKGRTKLIKLTQKFFDYFDLPIEKLKEKFKNVAKLEQAIEHKEEQIEAQKIEVYTTMERAEKPQTHVEVVKEKLGELDVYDTTPAPGTEEKKVGDLEVYTEEKKEKKKKRKEIVEEKPAEEQPPQEENEVLEPTPEEKKEEKPTEKKPPSKGMFQQGVPQDVEKKIDEIVQEIVTPKEEKKEE